MIVAIVPAAGLSSRMGGAVTKLLLPWGQHTVIEQVVSTLVAAEVERVLVVTGHQREAIESVLSRWNVTCVHNPCYRQGDMLSSIQAGLQALPDGCSGALLALADQPQLQTATVRKVIQAYCDGGNTQLVIPSYQMRRGHPIVLPTWLWPEVLALPEGESLRTVISRHSTSICYVDVATPSVLADLDTPEQYQDAVRASLP